MKKYVISIPYVYPACPLNIDHAKLFVLADVIARNRRARGQQVIFPVAAHYSGVAAHILTNSFKKIFSKPYKNLTDEEKKLLILYTDYYQTPNSILRTFSVPKDLLNFYSQEILWELRALNVSCDYETYYSTDSNDYSLFVSEILSQYKSLGVILQNAKNEMALNYNNTLWKQQTLKQINSTIFIQPFHKNNIISATNNIRNDWGMLRNEGLGVSYKQKWVIDPMFDSELFTVFDLYRHHQRDRKLSVSLKRKIFKELFVCLSKGTKPNLSVTKKIVKDLPCDLFIGEEHLKNWVVKKIYAETLLLPKNLRTRRYFIVGMGFLDGNRMSASKGNAILTKDLIRDYGHNVARMTILLCGGHPSKSYKYEKTIPSLAKKMMAGFLPYYQFLVSTQHESILPTHNKLKITMESQLQKNIDALYFRQALTDLFVTIPKRYPQPSAEEASTLIAVINKYLGILLPELFKQLVT